MVRTVVCPAGTVALLAFLAQADACSKPSGPAGSGGEAPVALAAPRLIASATGETRVIADEHGFTPSSVLVPKGAPGSRVTLTFVRTSDKTCATEVVFPDLQVNQPLPLNEAVSVQIPSDTARTLAFQCGMGMFKGALVVGVK